MNGITPVLEINESQSEVLRRRSSEISDFQDFGPADLCIVTREYKPRGLKKLLNKPYQSTSFHFIYGVNTSSVTSIAAYFKRLSDTFSNIRKEVIISGCFCTFDIFNKCDVRVEIEMPGHTSMFVIDSLGRKQEPTDENWKGCYLSSVLRFLYPRYSVASFKDMFETPSDIHRFFEIAEEYWPKLGFVLGDLEDVGQYGVNLLFPGVNRFLLTRQLHLLHQSVYKKMIEKDPLFLAFFSESSVKIAKFDEILTLLSNQLKITPHAFPLYFSISRAYYKKGDFEQAAKICQFLVELNLEVFEYWELLIKTFIKMQNFACALICLNNLPLYSVNCRNFEVSAKNLQRPETLSCSADKNFWTTPKDPDFIAFEHVSSSKSVKERSLLKKLQGLPSAKYTGGYRRGYKLLVKIEKAVEWDNLLKIRSDNLRRSNLQIDDPESESISTDLNRSGFIRTVYESIEYSVNIDTRIDFSIQPAQCLTVRNYFLSENPVNKLAKLFDFSHRQQSEGTSDFFASLHMDLKSVYEWQKEVSNIQVLYDSSQSKSYSEIPYSGEVWLLRAMLSERLMRFKSALRAYEYVTQKGFSLFAWSRIIHLTARAGCPANTIKAVVEVMKFVEMQKVFFDKIPPWIECVLARLCKECGVRQVISLIKEHPAKFKVLEEAVGKLKYWEVEGSR